MASAGSSTVNEEFVFAERPDGAPTKSTFQKVTIPMPTGATLSNGEVLICLLFTSVDPYMRGVLRSNQTGGVQSGLAVAEVLESKSAHYQKGDLLCDYLPWRRYSVHNADKSATCQKVDKSFLATHNLSPSIYLSLLGMVSTTAFFGIRDVLLVKPHSVIVVSGAAGATGFFACQYAKLFGASKVIGVAGGAEKCDFLMKEGVVDGVIDYKTCKSIQDVHEKLKELVPSGIDGYFDNVGGMVTDAVFDHLNKFARVAVCGQIAMYNTKNDETPLVPAFLHKLIYKSVTVQGFLVGDFRGKINEFKRDVQLWIAEKKLKDKQYFVKGFDALPEAFMGLFSGANLGKTIVEIDA